MNSLFQSRVASSAITMLNGSGHDQKAAHLAMMTAFQSLLQGGPQPGTSPKGRSLSYPPFS